MYSGSTPNIQAPIILNGRTRRKISSRRGTAAGGKQYTCGTCHQKCVQRYSITMGPRGGQKRVPIPHNNFCTGPCRRVYGSRPEECNFARGHALEVQAQRDKKEAKKRE